MKKYKVYKVTFEDGSTYYGSASIHPSIIISNLRNHTDKKIVELAKRDPKIEILDSFEDKEESIKFKNELVSKDPKCLNRANEKYNKYKVFKVTFEDGSTYYGSGDVHPSSIISNLRNRSNKKIAELAKKDPKIEILDSFEDKEESIKFKNELVSKDPKCLNRANEKYNKYKVFKVTFEDGSTYYGSGDVRPSSIITNLKYHSNKRIKDLSKEDQKIDILDSFDDKEESIKFKNELVSKDPKCLNKIDKKYNNYKVYKITFEDGSTYYLSGSIDPEIIPFALKNLQNKKIRELSEKDPEIEILDSFKDKEEAIEFRDELVSKDLKSINNKRLPKGILGDKEKYNKKYKVFKVTFEDGSTFYSLHNIPSKIVFSLKNHADKKIAELAKKDIEVKILDSFEDKEEAIKFRDELFSKDPKCLNKKTNSLNRIKKYEELHKYRVYKFTFEDGSTYYASGSSNSDIIESSLRNHSNKKIRELANKDLDVKLLNSFEDKEEAIKFRNELVSKDPKCLNVKGKERAKYRVYKVTFEDGSTYYTSGDFHSSKIEFALKNHTDEKISELAKKNLDIKLLDSFEDKEESIKFRNELVSKDSKCLNKIKERGKYRIKERGKYKKYKVYKVTFEEGSTYYASGNTHPINVLHSLKNHSNKKIAELSKKDPKIEILDSFKDKEESIKFKNESITEDPKSIQFKDLNILYSIEMEGGKKGYLISQIDKKNLEKILKEENPNFFKNIKSIETEKISKRIDILKNTLYIILKKESGAIDLNKSLSFSGYPEKDNDSGSVRKEFPTSVENPSPSLNPLPNPNTGKKYLYKLTFDDRSTYYGISGISDTNEFREFISSNMNKNFKVEQLASSESGAILNYKMKELMSKDPNCVNKIRESLVLNFQSWVKRL